MVHVEIEPIKAFVHESVLYDEDPTKKDMVECTVFALSSYVGEVPTFGIVLVDGSVFFYVPPHKLSLTNTQPIYELEDLVYHNCHEDDIVVHRLELLGSRPVSIYLKKVEEWVPGLYLFTVDWYKGNDLLHLVALESGQFCFMPSHKLKFLGGEHCFQPYKKMHSTWTV